MSSVVPRIALAALVVVAGGAVWASRSTTSEDIAAPQAIEVPADLPIEAPSAPAVQATDWLNSEPLAPADLEGKAVLYDFWTFGCYNCVNTLPHVKAWHERYAPDGLVLLSIHTPEFDYEEDPANVAQFVEENGIEYPVALDPDSVTWKAFENRAWPAFYLHDQEGRRRLTRIGEGRYEETENAIRVLLGVDPDSPRAVVAES